MNTNNHRTPTISMATVDTPVGQVIAAFHGRALCALHFAEGGKTSVWPVIARRFGPDAEVTEVEGKQPALDALEAYFGGRIDALASVEVDAAGTPFQKRVWRELRRIPAGRTASYAEIAKRVGTPTGYRAVARANATNPIGIVIPCHRVIGADGTLHGYGGGIERKRWLLEHESRAVDARA